MDGYQYSISDSYKNKYRYKKSWSVRVVKLASQNLGLQTEFVFPGEIVAIT